MNFKSFTYALKIHILFICISYNNTYFSNFILLNIDLNTKLYYTFLLYVNVNIIYINILILAL